MNVVMQSGILGNVPELVKTQTGKSVCTFTIAVYDGKDSTGLNKTQWHKWQAWDYTAERICRANKGDTIIVHGMARNNSYTNKENRNITEKIFIARDLFIQPKHGTVSSEDIELPEMNYDIPSDDEELDTDNLPF